MQEPGLGRPSDAINNILLLGILGVGGWFAYNQFIDNDDQVLKPDPNLPETTLTQAQSLSIAERLYDAMNGTFSNNKKVIMDALSGMSYNDFVAINNAFGYRWRSETLIPERHNLLGWLQRELNDKDLKKLYAIMPGVIGSSDITMINVDDSKASNDYSLLYGISIGDEVVAARDGVKGYITKKKNNFYEIPGDANTFRKGENVGKVHDIITYNGFPSAYIVPTWSLWGLIQKHVTIPLPDLREIRDYLTNPR